MTPYPFTRFSRKGEVWRHLGPDNQRIVGFIDRKRTRRGPWQIDIATRHYGQRITETRLLADAKQMCRELLA